MRKIIHVLSPLALLSLWMTACLEPFNPSVVVEERNYLVVDAHLDANGNANVRLSRTLPLYSEMSSPDEVNASVEIESEGGSHVLLDEITAGTYSGVVPVDVNERYRVRIVTANDERYMSDFAEVKISPPIDSVYWKPGADGISVYVDTHDNENDSRYYKWEVEETYEYTSQYASRYIWKDGQALPRPLDQMIFTCWRTDTSRHIMLGTTEQLERDIVSRKELVFVAKGAKKMSVRYSILVRQRTISSEAYEYFRLLEQTTEDLGGLFDPMPVEVTGNFHDLGDSNRPVIGYFTAGTVEEERLFIGFHELPRHLRVAQASGCFMDTLSLEDLLPLTESGLLLIGPIMPPGSPFISGYTTASKHCIDCRVYGGTTTKPDFW